MKILKARTLRLFIALLFCLNFSIDSSSQFYGDQEFYLIDSLNLGKISSNDKLLLDTSLVAYHNAQSDTISLSILEHIVDECWDSKIWPRYNEYLIHLLEKKLTIHSSPRLINQYLYFLAGAINNIGYLHDQKGEMLLALDNYHSSLKLYERVDNKTGISSSLNNLGVLYSMIGDTSKALTYHRRSLNLKNELKDSVGISMSLNNIGTIYENHYLPFEALKYYDLSLEMRIAINDHRGIAMSYDNIGDIYLSQSFAIAALGYYQKGLAEWELLQDNVGISTSCDNIANALIELDRYDEAKFFAERGRDISNEVGYIIDIRNSAITMSLINKHEGDYRKAVENLELYIEMRNKMENSELANAALKKSLLYEFDKTALHDSLQNAKIQEIQEIKITKQKAQNFALYLGLGLMLVILVVGIKSFQRKKKDNLLIRKQKIEVESKNKEITDSITYAKRIQQAILPPKELLNKHLKNSFILYKPKDVVSGDFYWVEELDNQIIFAVADCTGHGVPGALVSVVCHNALNRSVFEFGLEKPSEILNKTRELVIETFDRNEDSVKDGMDIALCSINQKTNEINYSGANNSLYYVEDNELKIIKADKQPIGKFDSTKSFTNHRFKLNKGSCIFLSSDGFPDQFGGPDGKKFKYKQFRELLFANYLKPMNEQSDILETTFDNWRGELEQIDDVCVMGIKI